MENKVKMNLNQIFFIILSVSILLIIPSAFAEETISVDLKLNKENIQYGDPAFLVITPDRIVPNTDFFIEVTQDGKIMPLGPVGTGSLKIPDGQSKVIHHIPFARGQPSDQPFMGNFEIDVYYGTIENNLGSNSIKLNFDPTPSETTKFILDNYFPDKFDVGTAWNIDKSLRKIELPLNFCEINFCYESGIAKKFNLVSSSSISTQIEIFEFNDTDSTKKAYEKLFERPFNSNFGKDRTEFNIDEFECISAKWWKNFIVRYTIICNAENELFRILTIKTNSDGDFDHVKQSMIFAESVANRISQNTISSKTIQSTESTHQLTTASFVDPNKDPQHYLDRYYNEPKYRDWFDANYPNYTIEEAVGLEIKSKIPEWIKNIFEWYSQGQIGDEDLIKALQFLIKEGIIRV